MNTYYYHTFTCCLGTIWLYEANNRLVKLAFEPLPIIALKRRTSLLIEAEWQLKSYLNGRTREFRLDISLDGTLFQQRVWQHLQTIPYGKTYTYGEIARQIGYPKAYRAIGNACRNNPIPIIVPCHRVVATNPKIINYIGGKTNKLKLIHLEQQTN